MAVSGSREQSSDAEIVSVPWLESARSKLSTYLGRLSSRERLLLAIMALVAGLLAPLKMSDWTVSEADAIAQSRAHLIELTRNKELDVAEAKLSELAIERKRWASWTWTAPSEAVARLLMEQQLVTVAVQAGLTSPDVKAAEGLESIGGVRFVRVELSSAGSWKALSDLVQGLARSGRGFVLEKASLNDEGGGPRVRLVVLMPVQIGRGVR